RDRSGEPARRRRRVSEGQASLRQAIVVTPLAVRHQIVCDGDGRRPTADARVTFSVTFWDDLSTNHGHTTGYGDVTCAVNDDTLSDWLREALLLMSVGEIRHLTVPGEVWGWLGGRQDVERRVVVRLSAIVADAKAHANSLIDAYGHVCRIDPPPRIRWSWESALFRAKFEGRRQTRCSKPRKLTQDDITSAFERIRERCEADAELECFVVTEEDKQPAKTEQASGEDETTREPLLTRNGVSRFAHELLREHERSQGVNRKLCWMRVNFNGAGRGCFEVHVRPKEATGRPVMEGFRIERATRKESGACDQPLLDPTVELPDEHVLPKRTACDYCDALVWEGEGGSFCCQQGKTVLDNLSVPDELRSLLASRYGKELRAKSLYLNNTFAMTAIGYDTSSDLAASLPQDWGNVRIHGRVYHRIISAEDNPIVWLMFDNKAAETELKKRVDQMCKETGSAAAHDRERQAYEYLVTELKEILRENNPFVRDLRAFGRLVEHGRKDIILEFKFKEEADDVCLVLPCSSSAYLPQQRKVCISLKKSTRRGESTEFVDVLSPVYEPLQYPLLFAQGTPGWYPSMPIESRGNFHLFAESTYIKNMIDRRFYTRAWHEPDVLEGTARRCERFWTQLKYMRQRLLKEPLLHTMPRLGQGYTLDMFSRIEDERLNFIRNNQLRLLKLSELQREEDPEYQQLLAENEDMEDHAKAGFVLLPSSFLGSERYYKKLCQDAFAIVAQYGKPSWFITITCNGSWKEIHENLEQGQNAYDRPDLTSRVFHLKLRALLKRLRNGPLGKSVYLMSVIEYQKRGLSHAHITVRHDRHPLTGPDVDLFVCAEVPRHNRRLRKLVETFMIHKCSARCRDEDSLKEYHRCLRAHEPVVERCKYGFPQPLSAETQFDARGHCIYRRRQEEDRWVAPYCPQLLAEFNCHLYVDCAASTNVIAYLYKYMYKPEKSAFRVSVHQEADRKRKRGADDGDSPPDDEQPSAKRQRQRHTARRMASLLTSTHTQEPTKQPGRDEVRDYQQGRVLCASEACHRICGHQIHWTEPSRP
ncbi:unnamed protein product, partial [Vitrella brassicaformis CCMP3155]